ncbi:hypothetical protein PoB_005784100 [Plakobranchus ocellatus]|uniref:Uncharacterized protein n=1 Tax=Plakobranchus ocellatus TaxID=259542 RepID=A0AAV4CIN8_9GAST|nr:hypothetical protein PoB_005784100 [Plakobranchus ocellatus]
MHTVYLHHGVADFQEVVCDNFYIVAVVQSEASWQPDFCFVPKMDSHFSTNTLVGWSGLANDLRQMLLFLWKRMAQCLVPLSGKAEGAGEGAGSNPTQT